MTTRGAAIDVRSLRETLAAIQALGGSPGRRVLRKSINAATTPVAKVMRQIVPRRTGALKSSITKKVVSKAAQGRFTGVVGARNLRSGTDKQVARWGAKYGRANPVWYFHLVDQGAKQHAIGPRAGRAIAFQRAGGGVVVRRSVVHPGAPAQNVITKAFSASNQAAVKAFADKASAELAAEYQKLRAKQVTR